MRRFQGEIAVVTGGSKGIGRAIALRLADEGADVAISWFRDRTAATETLTELRRMDVRAHAARSTLGEERSAFRLIEEVRELMGEPTLLVSNAASGVYRRARELKHRHWEWTMETNTVAFLRLMQSAHNVHSAVALTSMGSSRALPGYAATGASKAALESLVRYLAVELAPTTRVNAVSPSFVDTASPRRILPNYEGAIARVREATPARRLVAPEDVASLAAFLLSREAEMITGQVIVIDGGYSVTA